MEDNEGPPLQVQVMTPASPGFGALCHEKTVEYAMSARDILRLRITSKALWQTVEAAATSVATGRLEARTALTLGHPALAEYRSSLELLCMLERPPNIGPLMRAYPPISEYGDPRDALHGGRFQDIKRVFGDTTDYRNVRACTYIVEKTIRFGDAAVIESVLSSLVGRSLEVPFDDDDEELKEELHNSVYGSSDFMRTFCNFVPSVMERDTAQFLPELVPDRSWSRYMKKPEDFKTDEHVPSFLHNEHIVFYFIRREQQQIKLVGLDDACGPGEPDIIDHMMPRTPQPTVLKDTYPGWERQYFYSPGLTSEENFSDFVGAAIAAGRMDILQELYDLGAPMGDKYKFYYSQTIERCRVTGQSFRADAKRTAWTSAINEIEQWVRAAQP